MKLLAAIRTAALGTAALGSSAFAHEGHGAALAHWHATDTWGLLVVGGLAAGAAWLSWRAR